MSNQKYKHSVVNDLAFGYALAEGQYRELISEITRFLPAEAKKQLKKDTDILLNTFSHMADMVCEFHDADMEKMKE